MLESAQNWSPNGTYNYCLTITGNVSDFEKKINLVTANKMYKQEYLEVTFPARP